MTGHLCKMWSQEYCEAARGRYCGDPGYLPLGDYSATAWYPSEDTLEDLGIYVTEDDSKISIQESGALGYKVLFSKAGRHHDGVANQDPFLGKYRGLGKFPQTRSHDFGNDFDHCTISAITKHGDQAYGGDHVLTHVFVIEYFTEDERVAVVVYESDKGEHW